MIEFKAPDMMVKDSEGEHICMECFEAFQQGTKKRDQYGNALCEYHFQEFLKRKVIKNGGKYD